MPLEFGGQLHQFRNAQRRTIDLLGKRIGDAETTDHRGGRGTQPTRVRNGIATVHIKAVDPQPVGGQAAFDGADDQMIPGCRNLPGTLPLHVDAQSGFGCLDRDFVRDPQRQAHAVEAGAEVGTGTGDDGVTAEPGGKSLIGHHDGR
ncbi:hypothetical protein MFAL_40170 [Mycolicibacterium fallax]|nr:hypothetical protein MFAL_40170 [Mycolicibacterium fallax]